MAGYSYSTDANGATFKVASTIQPATYIVGAIILAGLFGPLGLRKILLIVGVLLALPVAFEFFRNRRNPAFLVSPAGINVSGATIPAERINSIDIKNSKGGFIAEGTVVTGGVATGSAAATHEMTKGYYYLVTVLHGGKRTRLAGGLKADTALGLVADIRRALNGDLR